MGLVWDLELKAPERMVLLAMADHAHHDGTHVFPSIGLVAWKTGYSESQTRRIIKRLVSAKLLSKETRDGYTNLYTIHVENGIKKPPYKSMEEVSKENPLQNDTPPKMTPDPLHSYDTPTPVIAMTPEPSLEPSINHIGAGKPRRVNPTFNLVAKKSFGIEDIAKLEDNGGRIGKISGWLKKHKATEDNVIAFYLWYGKDTDNAAPPRDLEKFKEWYLKFEECLSKKIIRDDGYIPVSERTSVLDGLELA